MNGAKSKEIKEKVFEKMFGTGYSEADKKFLMEADNFKDEYRKTKKKYTKTPQAKSTR